MRQPPMPTLQREELPRGVEKTAYYLAPLSNLSSSTPHQPFFFAMATPASSVVYLRNNDIGVNDQSCCRYPGMIMMQILILLNHRF
eukprot:scaffold57859_cov50-Attheya_sp.AAC.4